MTKQSIWLPLIILLSFSLTSVADNKKSQKSKNANKCHVIGDITRNDISKKKGSKKNPYGSLAEVEADFTCEYIIVLYSDTALDGGITLRDGQTIEGASSRNDNNALPVITNSSGLLNNGSGIVLADYSTVKNLHIKDAYRFGIEGVDVKDSKVLSNLITGHNTSGELPAVSYIGFPTGNSGLWLHSRYVSATHQVKDNIIRESLNVGLSVFSDGGSTLTINAKNNEITDIVGLPFNSSNPAVLAFAVFPASVLNLNIDKLKVRNIGSDTFSVSSGMDVFSLDGAEVYTNLNHYDYRGTGVADTGRYGIETITSDSSFSFFLPPPVPDAINHFKMENSIIFEANAIGFVSLGFTGFVTGVPVLAPGEINDLGGGPLGSLGRNQIYDNKASVPGNFTFPGFYLELTAFYSSIFAKNNWWGDARGLRDLGGLIEQENLDVMDEHYSALFPNQFGSIDAEPHCLDPACKRIAEGYGNTTPDKSKKPKKPKKP